MHAYVGVKIPRMSLRKFLRLPLTLFARSYFPGLMACYEIDGTLWVPRRLASANERAGVAGKSRESENAGPTFVRKLQGRGSPFSCGARCDRNFNRRRIQ